MQSLYLLCFSEICTNLVYSPLISIPQIVGNVLLLFYFHCSFSLGFCEVLMNVPFTGLHDPCPVSRTTHICWSCSCCLALCVLVNNNNNSLWDFLQLKCMHHTWCLQQKGTHARTNKIWKKLNPSAHKKLLTGSIFSNLEYKVFCHLYRHCRGWHYVMIPTSSVPENLPCSFLASDLHRGLNDWPQDPLHRFLFHLSLCATPAISMFRAWSYREAAPTPSISHISLTTFSLPRTLMQARHILS